MTLVILRSSAHAHPDWRRCGGGRRSEQLEDILRRHGIDWTDAAEARPATRLDWLRAAWYLRTTSPRIKMKPDRNLIRYLASDYLRYRSTLRSASAPAVFLVEEAIDYPRIRAAHDMRTPIVAAPHNLETIQQTPPRDFYSGEELPFCLQREIDFLALSRVVFCISREEQWLLANHGINADFLPYHPPVSTRDRLQRIRAARVGTARTSELFAFTTGNSTKNLEGLIALSELVAAMPANSGFHLHVGGFETEKARRYFPTDRCTFHGEVDDATLETLMIRCQASVVCQYSGAGALTRIPELLCAGIPVLATPHAARSAQHLDGVHIFHDAVELLALSRSDPPIPRAPTPDTAAEDRFAGWIRRLAAEPRSDIR
ncbi:MAG TPA: hypothetical protein VHE61_13550 [Opitutaceae bacterium]|nr:hypothetical protein [Opitutaceae bacterium]